MDALDRSRARRSLPRRGAEGTAPPPNDEAATSVRRAAAAECGFAADEPGARDYLADAEPSVRAAALYSLARLGAIGPTEIAAAIADRSPIVRLAVAELAPTLGEGTFSVLLFDEEPSVVEAACFAVGARGEDSAITRLVEIAGVHLDPLCRESAVAALGVLGGEQGLPAVFSALDDRPEIRRRAVVALASFSGKEVTAALQARLGDRDWQVRQAAEDVLQMSGITPGEDGAGLIGPEGR
jgi:HEAT repeat protein